MQLYHILVQGVGQLLTGQLPTRTTINYDYSELLQVNRPLRKLPSITDAVGNCLVGNCPDTHFSSKLHKA